MSGRSQQQDVRCHFDGRGRGCLGAAVVQRGSVPLCEACEAGSSSLKRLAMTPLGTGMYVDGRPSGVAPVTVHEQLYRITKAVALLRTAEARRAQAVRAAYQAGASWVAIGKALGVSRQSAQATYGASSS